MFYEKRKYKYNKIKKNNDYIKSDIFIMNYIYINKKFHFSFRSF